MNAGLIQVDIHDRNGVPIVALEGELDLSNAHVLKKALATLDPAVSLAVVDLTNVTFIDSTGLQAITTYGRGLIERDATLYIVATRPGVRKIFNITQIDRYFPVIQSLDELPL